MELLAVLVIFLAGDTLAANSKIINGELAVEGQFPHMVQLSIRRKEATKYCGGSLINSQWVLTVRGGLLLSQSRFTTLNFRQHIA